MLAELFLINWKIMVSFWGLPDLVDPMGGAWYRITDQESDVYIPFETEELDNEDYEDIEKIPAGPGNPIYKNRGTNVMGRISALKKGMDVYLQILRWAFKIYMKDVKFDSTTILKTYQGDPFKNHVKEFTDQYMRISEGHQYDFDEVREELPLGKNLKESMRMLGAPSIVINDRIIVSGREMFGQVKDYLYQFLRARESLKIEVPESVNLYFTIDDFDKRDGVRIFMSEEEVNFWTKQKSSELFMGVYVRREIRPSDWKNENPIYYADNDGHYFMIQNTFFGNLNMALMLSYNWYKNKINLGYLADKTLTTGTEGNYPYAIMSISNANSLIISKDLSDGQENFLLVAMLGNNHYASVMRLI
jgi:hypothetical protein